MQERVAEYVGVDFSSEFVAAAEMCATRRSLVRCLSHYNPLVRPLHMLSHQSWIGRAFRARLFIVAHR
jgi:hypothetical protein